MSQTAYARPNLCQYPGCANTGGLRPCEKLDARWVCPEHRREENGIVVCGVCQERLAALLASSEAEAESRAAAAQAMSRNVWRGLIARNIAGLLPAALALVIIIALVETRLGPQYRELYPFGAIAIFGAMMASAVMNWSAPTARGGDFGSGWRAGKRYDR